MEKNNPDKILSPFLRKLADDLDNGKLSAEQKQKLGEFYMSWLLQQSEENPEEDNDEDYDALKFLTMGWYVYTQILEGRTV
jgi:hypothetical protein